MEDRHTAADDGWVSGERNQARRIMGSNAWPRCAFYGCYDGHGGSRTATVVARQLWKSIQGNLVERCRESSSHLDAATAPAADNGSGSLLVRADPGVDTDADAPRLPGPPEASNGTQAAAADAAAPAGRPPPSRASGSQGAGAELSAEELEKIMFASFAETEADVCQQARRGRWEDGCTAVTCLLFGQHLIIGNLGDSRAVLCTASGKAVRLSEDHKPSTPSELARIHAAGGFVRTVAGIARLQGDLSLSRAFGDVSYKARPARPASTKSPTRTTSPTRRAHSPTKSQAAKSPSGRAAKAAVSPPASKWDAAASGKSAESKWDAAMGGKSADAGGAPAAAEPASGPTADGGGELGRSWAAIAATPKPAGGLGYPTGSAPAKEGGSKEGGVSKEKEGPLSAVPDVFKRKLTADDRFLILACDGVWDVFSDELAVRHVTSGLKSNKNDPLRAAEHLVEQVLRSGRCTDNVTAVVVLLQFG